MTALEIAVTLGLLAVVFAILMVGMIVWLGLCALIERITQ